MCMTTKGKTKGWFRGHFIKFFRLKAHDEENTYRLHDKNPLDDLP